jgi:hypothetical protein
MTKKIEGMAEIEDFPDGTMKIHFAPGCFDEFEGTQEELDLAIAEITRLVESGEFIESSQVIDIDQDLEEDSEIAKSILKALDRDTVKRTLQ